MVFLAQCPDPRIYRHAGKALEAACIRAGMDPSVCDHFRKYPAGLPADLNWMAGADKQRTGTT